MLQPSTPPMPGLMAGSASRKRKGTPRLFQRGKSRLRAQSQLRCGESEGNESPARAPRKSFCLRGLTWVAPHYHISFRSLRILQSLSFLHEAGPSSMHYRKALSTESLLRLVVAGSQIHEKQNACSIECTFPSRRSPFKSKCFSCLASSTPSQVGDRACAQAGSVRLALEKPICPSQP